MPAARMFRPVAPLETSASTSGDVTSVLLDCLHQDPRRAGRERLASLTDAEWVSLVELAREQGVKSLLHDRLASRGIDALVPDRIRAGLATTFRHIAARNLLILHGAGRAAAALQAHGIPVIVLKGAFLATEVYRNPAGRSMVDVDLLVPVEHVGSASKILQAEGYEPQAPIALGDPAAAYPQQHHLPRFMKPGHAGIELHWRLAPNPHCDVPGLWQRGRPARVGGVDTLALCAEDLLLHLCGHATYNHVIEMGLRPSCDIAETIRRFGDRLDWSALVARAAEWRWSRGVYLSLRLARDLVGAAVPDAVLLALQPVEFDDTLIAVARGITLTDGRKNRAMPATMVKMSDAATFQAKVRACVRQIFVPRSELADHYAVRRDSRRLLFYYLVRLKDLLVRHGRTAVRVFRGDPALASMAHQKAIVQDWLAEHDATTRSSHHG